MGEVEDVMKAGFECLAQARRNFELAITLYKQRNDEKKGDFFNARNVSTSVSLLADAYDEISAIWENDIQK